MKAQGAGRDDAASGRRRRNTDFLFVGAGVAPLVLMLGGQPGIAFLLLIPLLFAACLFGAWEQAVSSTENSVGDYGEPLAHKRPAAGFTERGGTGPFRENLSGPSRPPHTSRFRDRLKRKRS